MASSAVDLIGWASSAVLLATIMRQVYTQWKTKSCVGLSKWLFIGQLTASVGYTVYSLLLHNWVFASSNIALLCTAVLGQILYVKNKHNASSGAPTGAAEHVGPQARAPGGTSVSPSTTP
jgi:MtN3 and saliva related transmembrane protein